MPRRRQQTLSRTGLDDGPPRGKGDGTLGKNNAEQERPYLAAESGKDRTYKAGWRKAGGAGRESERSVVPTKARRITRWREGALL
jgi:hypothetical protein